jgi:CRISPR-associated protein Cas1
MNGIEVTKNHLGVVTGYKVPLTYEQRAENRISQYQSNLNGKSLEIAKEIIKTKVKRQSINISYFGLENQKVRRGTEFREPNKIIDSELNKLDKIKSLSRNKLVLIEGRINEAYWNSLKKVIPEKYHFELRVKRGATDKFNNLLNLSYSFLFNLVLEKTLEAHLDTHMGFIHSIQYSKPSFILDVMELYRPIIDYYVVLGSHHLSVKKDFKQKNKRQFLKTEYFNLWRKRHELLFQTKFTVNKARWGSNLALHRIIGEDILNIAGYLRGNKKLEFIQFDYYVPNGLIKNTYNNFG